ncbi:hypothetical protein M2360_004561 [Rhizobium sp. SG_E_25_P2]|nr:hypothetical protein [Rhizobium sp. SG_E_25_P2]MDH6269135.1 hypothetical protein [Rhizobium sp. SG_E_25_P2]
MAITLLHIIRGSEPHGLMPGATLNKIAPHFGPPDGWTFPWTDPFGGSIE